VYGGWEGQLGRGRERREERTGLGELAGKEKRRRYSEHVPPFPPSQLQTKYQVREYMQSTRRDSR
jgi:hypothetical protein